MVLTLRTAPGFPALPERGEGRGRSVPVRQVLSCCWYHGVQEITGIRVQTRRPPRQAPQPQPGHQCISSVARGAPPHLWGRKPPEPAGCQQEPCFLESAPRVDSFLHLKAQGNSETPKAWQAPLPNLGISRDTFAGRDASPPSSPVCIPRERCASTLQWPLSFCPPSTSRSLGQTQLPSAGPAPLFPSE